MRPTWAEINLGSIAHNIRAMKKLLRPNVRLMSVVKANAYGHGDIPVAQSVIAAGADALGVASLDEAVALREAGIVADILLLGYTMPEYFTDALHYGVELTVFRYEDILLLSKAAQTIGKEAKIHIKINTGMNRLGFSADDITVKIIADVVKLPGIYLQGIFTHFASADSRDLTHACQQLDQFVHLLKHLNMAKIKIPIRHAANSAAFMMMPESHLDMVRAGILCYGLYPSREVDETCLPLKPSMSLKTKIVQLQEVQAGERIGYGGTHQLDRLSMIATVPIGYADGYSRLLSNQARALLHGQKVPLIGRVCMDQCMFDVTDVPQTQLLDEITLFGPEKVTADDLGHWIKTINYEIVCMVGSRVPRVYVE